MKRGEWLWQRLADGADLSDEVMPGQPVVEIAGQCRVLIENHMGVKGYSSERIVVKVKYGYVHVCGACLELSRMTSEQLVIRGRIDQISLHRRG